MFSQHCSLDLIDRSTKTAQMSEDTKDRLAFTAMRLFSEKGYGSTSVSDILNAAGANSGTVHHRHRTSRHKSRDGTPAARHPASVVHCDTVVQAMTTCGRCR